MSISVTTRLSLSKQSCMCWIVAATALLGYEIIITQGQESKYLWRWDCWYLLVISSSSPRLIFSSPRKFVKIPYFFIRYFGISFLAVEVFGEFALPVFRSIYNLGYAANLSTNLPLNVSPINISYFCRWLPMLRRCCQLYVQHNR